MYAVNGILFNHESPMRGETFVTRKITRAVAQIALGKLDMTHLGNLDARRDWGHAKDYVRAMWLTLQQSKAEDYVVATGITTSIRDFMKMAFSEVGIDIGFEGSSIDEVGIVTACRDSRYQVPIGQTIAAIDPVYSRPTEVELLIGDATKARQQLGWQPEYTLQEMVAEMVQSDLKFFLT